MNISKQDLLYRFVTHLINEPRLGLSPNNGEFPSTVCELTTYLMKYLLGITLFIVLGASIIITCIGLPLYLIIYVLSPIDPSFYREVWPVMTLQGAFYLFLLWCWLGDKLIILWCIMHTDRSKIRCVSKST